MKKIHLALLFSLAVLTASAQKVYFVYIQTESEQPFFVKMNEKVSSSTASGYVILSKLVDSTYSFSIGFPQNKWPEQNFSVAIAKKDHGYLLKNFGEKGWGLFDLQTLSVQMAITGKAGIEVPKELNKDISPFTEILSKAADDPSLKEKQVQLKTEEKPALAVETKKEEPKTELKETVIAKPVELKEQPVEKKEEAKTELKEVVAAKPEITEQPVASKVELKETVTSKPVETIEQPVVKKEEPKQAVVITQTESPEPVFKKDDSKLEKQPVVTQLELKEQPVEKKEEPKTEIKEQAVTRTEEVKAEPVEPYKVSVVKKMTESSTTEGLGLTFIDDDRKGISDTIRLVIPNPKPAIATIKEEPKEEKKFIEVAEAPKKEEITTNPVSEEKVTTVKNKCRLTATEADFIRLRKKMAGAPSDDGMVGEAKRFFKTMCFSTAQIKTLSLLLVTDEGKYNFFDAAYKSVYDLESFSSLNGEIRDKYYAGRFNAMLRN